MPELDGLSALKEIIAFDPSAKVIICSAVIQPDIIRDALDLGALGFLAKPFRPEELEKIITNFLGPNSSDLFST